MNSENKNISNDNNIKNSKIQNDKNISTFTPFNEKEPNDIGTKQNIMNLQGSACKNLKNDVKSESANIYL